MRAFIEKGLGITLTPAECIGWGRGGRLIAAVAFHNYDKRGGVIELSAYSTARDWLTKERLRDLFAYPFDQLKVRLCVARIAEGNRRARRIWRALGAKEFVIPELRGAGEAECLFLLDQTTWTKGKFMREDNGKERTDRTRPL